MDAGAIECIHEMIYNRTHFERGLHRLCQAYYAELPQVYFNVKILEEEQFPLSNIELG